MPRKAGVQVEIARFTTRGAVPGASLPSGTGWRLTTRGSSPATPEIASNWPRRGVCRQSRGTRWHFRRLWKPHNEHCEPRALLEGNSSGPRPSIARLLLPGDHRSRPPPAVAAALAEEEEHSRRRHQTAAWDETEKPDRRRCRDDRSLTRATVSPVLRPERPSSPDAHVLTRSGRGPNQSGSARGPRVPHRLAIQSSRLRHSVTAGAAAVFPEAVYGSCSMEVPRAARCRVGTAAVPLSGRVGATRVRVVAALVGLRGESGVLGGVGPEGNEHRVAYDRHSVR
jgi:hypothetical protein